jgi:calcineurin-like phosphoesterase family protein
VKIALIIANVFAAVTLYILGDFAVAAHRTHALSVYEELKSRQVLVERPDYDIEKRLTTIADSGGYFLILSRLGFTVCLANAAAIGFLWKRQKPRRLTD